jgi:hypothetical protein
MHRHTELSFVDEFQWVSPLHYLKKRMTESSSFWCMLQAGPLSLHYYFALVLHSCTYCHLSATLHTMSIVIVNLQEKQAVF